MWISVCNWRKFQHYDPSKRRPVWIKNNLDLTSRDEYRDLKAGARAALHGIWIEYASSRCRLKFDSKSISSRLNLRVTKQHLESLVQAGFIEVVASKSLAAGYHDASLEVEVEKEKEERASKPLDHGAPTSSNGKALGFHQQQIKQSLAEADANRGAT